MRKTFPQFIDHRYGENTYAEISKIFSEDISYDEKMDKARAYLKGASGKTISRTAMTGWYTNYRNIEGKS